MPAGAAGGAGAAGAAGLAGAGAAAAAAASLTVHLVVISTGDDPELAISTLHEQPHEHNVSIDKWQRALERGMTARELLGPFSSWMELNPQQLPGPENVSRPAWTWQKPSPPMMQFVGVRVKLKLALAILEARLDHRTDTVSEVCTASEALHKAVAHGLEEVAQRLLDHCPELLDCHVEGVPRPGTCDCDWLFKAVTSRWMPDEPTRVRMVSILLSKYRARALQHDQPKPFDSIGRNGTYSPEFFSLKEAQKRGLDEVTQELVRAGVPEQVDMDWLEAVRRHSAPDSVSRGFDAGDNSAGGSGGVITDSLSRTAMQLFAGNAPMALGYMVGKVGLEDSPPPGSNGWASLDPGKVRENELRQRQLLDARAAHLEARLLQAEQARLRDELLREEKEQARLRDKLLSEQRVLRCKQADAEEVRRHPLTPLTADAAAFGVSLPCPALTLHVPCAAGAAGLRVQPGLRAGHAAATCTQRRPCGLAPRARVHLWWFGTHRRLRRAARGRRGPHMYLRAAQRAPGRASAAPLPLLGSR